MPTCILHMLSSGESSGSIWTWWSGAAEGWGGTPKAQLVRHYEGAAEKEVGIRNGGQGLG